MLKLILKLIFPISTIIVLLILLFNTKQVDPMFYLLLIPAFASVVYAAVDIWDFCEKSRKDAASDTAEINKRLREIHVNFRVNFYPTLKNFDIVQDRSELTPEYIYELSKDDRVTSLFDDQFPGIFDAFKEFSELYEQTGD